MPDSVESDDMTSMRDAAMTSKAWPFEEARRLLKRYENKPPEKGYVLFETGYGPSGLPHIGTFGEVLRTTMIRRAFEVISDIPTKLICFSDDLDGMRKVPGNVPNQEELATHMHKPLTSVPDPFGEFDSFGDHNNAMLRRFLDTFGFDYEFYSPETGRVLYVPMKHVDGVNHTVTFDDEDGKEWTLPVTGGNVKLQWKPDFGARWAALDVDFEMYGKEHATNTAIYDRICEILGGKKPEHFSYELFLDENGQKISKSSGNGISIDQWLSYASTESLSYFMYLKPKTAKRMHFDVIPKAVDEYHQQLRAYADQEAAGRANNPVYHIHGHNVPASDMVVPFAMLLNLASVSGAEDKDTLWGFIKRYAPDASADKNPQMDQAAGFAVRYYNDFVKPTKVYRDPDAQERAAMEDLVARLKVWDGGLDAEELQSMVFAVGKEHGFEPLRGWFTALYEVLLGASQGPRFGGFIALYGVDETVALIEGRSSLILLRGPI